jgi:putative endonuclease
VSDGSAALGRAGEATAARWYEANGYEVVARNWRCPAGELDIVARQSGVIVFCEVKARSTIRFGTPAEAVTPSRCRRLRRAAAWFLASSDNPSARPYRLVRFDVAEVREGRVTVIEGAF